MSLENLNKAIGVGLQPLVIPEPLSLSMWADEHFYLSGESSSIEGKWESLPYQVAILDWIGNDDIEVLTLKKSARVGYTKMVMAAIGYFAEHKKRNQLIYQPTDSDAHDFSEGEIKPMLIDVAAVRNVMMSDPETRNSNNTTTKKKFTGSVLDIKGGKSGRNYRRMTKDVVYYDELDGFDLDIDGEGSPTILGDTRITTSSFPKSVRGSTPLEKDTSMIEASLRQADMVFRRHIPCPDCHQLQPLEWKRCVFDSKKTNGGSVGWVCMYCGSMFVHSQYVAMDARGVWKTDHGVWYDEEKEFFFNQDGARVDPPLHIGVVLWSAYSHFQVWDKLVRKFLDATMEKKKGILSPMKSFVNLDLGESWKNKGQQVNIDFVERQEPYHPDDRIPNGVLFITVGVDVQGGKKARLELEVVGWGLGRESWSLDYVVIKGDPKQQHVWDHLDEQRGRVFVRDDGVKLHINGVGIDAGYLSSEVYAYTGPRWRKRVFATMGKPNYKGPLVNSPKKQGKGRAKSLLYTINTDEAKELVYGRLDEVYDPGPGYCHFPEHYEQEYFDMLTSEEKIPVYKRGHMVNEKWRKIRSRNEALDCRVINTAVLQIVNPNFQALKKRLERLAIKPEQPKQETYTQQALKKRQKRRIMPKAQAGFVNGWR